MFDRIGGVSAQGLVVGVWRDVVVCTICGFYFCLSCCSRSWCARVCSLGVHVCDWPLQVPLHRRWCWIEGPCLPMPLLNTHSVLSVAFFKANTGAHTLKSNGCSHTL
jgi:hypothetical protein